MIFGRSKRRGSADLPMTSADPVAPADTTDTTDSDSTGSIGTDSASTPPTTGTPSTDGSATGTDTAATDTAAEDATPASSQTPEVPADAGTDGSPEEPATAPAPGPAVDVLDRAEHGPHDVGEITDRDGYLDLGAIMIKPVQNVMLRLEVQEATNRVLAAILDLGESSLQLQAFAAPRSAGLWDEIRAQIAEGVTAQSGQAHEVRTSFGTELLAAVPTVAGADAGLRVARFVGVDGPRWFLRGVITGAAATDDEQAAAIEALFRDVVVVRGTEAMAPRDLLTLSIPGVEDAGDTPEGPTPDGPPERGPEVTQIG
ncbi:DUF3710 domain-containing protein [Tersicoccus sp. Bi-70]|uniref:DUF3710 domain-containing protein n=1 Tax=Tersicoccus sp. Bi-70 TaxID=1897634 RepID=UPI001E303292|nr:DUF3710 domain-containing protein [Tersicoccus sp. Bi-70]